MRRLLTFLIAMVMATLGWIVTASIAAGTTPEQLPATYTYNAPHYDAPGSGRAQERGPPSVAVTDSTLGAVDGWSRGLSDRLEVLVAQAVITYAYRAMLGPDAQATTTTARHAAVADTVFSSVQPAQDAANSVPASEIRFSQRSVNGAAEIEASMRANGWVGDAIDVVRMPDGALTSLDNTRLLAANRAGIDVQANVHAFDALIPESMAGRFLSRSGAAPTTWGEAISNRIAGQGAMYRNRYPSGSPFTGWSGN